MSPSNPLPYSDRFGSPDEYLQSLLKFYQDPLFSVLCGGIHILDFFTRDAPGTEAPDLYSAIVPTEWREYFAQHDIHDILDVLMRTPVEDIHTDVVPESLKTFIVHTRDHSLRREFVRCKKSQDAIEQRSQGMEWALNAGMRPKKVHEVEHFASFVDELVRDIDGEEAMKNADPTKNNDESTTASSSNPTASPPAGTGTGNKISHILDYGSGQAYLSRTLAKKYGHNLVGLESRAVNIAGAKDLDQRFDHLFTKKHRHWVKRAETRNSTEPPPEQPAAGTLEYIETHVTSDGTLTSLLSPAHSSLLLTSLHSCGNLLHHALRAFAATPAVRGVALVGCCYNLLTEKSGATFKLPALRNAHPRLTSTSTEHDPDGFPLSARFEGSGVKLNVTARSMACQAPQNWTREGSKEFFKRHFFRALLQRILKDKGALSADPDAPVIIGSLKKAAYATFPEYVSAALSKLGWTQQVEVTKKEAGRYEREFDHRRRDLSVVWGLMAFTAGVVESIILTDRWLFCREMGCKEAWVEAAFDYAKSPRNLVVVGIR